MNKKKRFREISRFRKDVQSQISKTTTQTHNFFLIMRFSYFSILLFGCVNKFKYLFCLIVPLKSVRSLQSFPKCPRSLVRVRVVNVTRSQHCHSVRVVNDYADTKSA